MTDYDLRSISLGAGVQSSAMYLMACEGLLGDRPDVAIFADTQQEPSWVYENLWRLAEYGGDVIPIHIATAGDLGDHISNAIDGEAARFASVPFWVETEDGDAAPARRQCTREFKIDVVKGHVRELLGLQPRQHAKGHYRVEEWLGISLDEVTRAKPSRYDWIDTRWPFLFDRPMRRWEIEEWLVDFGWQEVKKSACVFCPFRRPEEYLRWREEEPELWEEACRWDDEIRSNGTLKGMERPQYLTPMLKPLRELTEEDVVDDEGQIDLFGNECEGMCGV